MSLEDALDALKKERLEAARYRKRAQEYDDLLKEQENAKLSETERLQKQLAEAQRERDLITQASQERVIRADVRATARELGLKPELALKLIDLAAVSFDEAGDPTNISELLTQAIADYGISVAGVTSASAPATSASPTSSAASGAAPQPGRAAPQAPQTGATNPPRSGQVNGAAGVFSRDEIPNLTDPRLWKRG
jgi:actin-related protein